MQLLRVLYVEDDPNLRATMTRALRREGFAVHCAASMAEALKVIAEDGFDVVLLDVNLPDSMGTETVRLAVTSTRAPIVVFSGSGDADSEVAKAALAAGAVEWIPKNAGAHVVARLLRIAYGRVRGGELLSAYVRGR